MTGAFPYLDLAIGISFVYLLLALVCTTLNETIAGILNSRGTNLVNGITQLLRDPALTQLIYHHPLVQGVQQGADARLPSYLSSGKFAIVLMDVLTGEASPNDPIALRRGIDAPTNPETMTVLKAVLANNSALKSDQERLEAWYDESMKRVSGWYKRTSQIRIFVLAAIVTVLLNADTMKMIKVLWYNPTLSALVVENAKTRQQQAIAGQGSGQMKDGSSASNTSDQSKPSPDSIQTGGSGNQSEKPVITPQEEAALQQVTGWTGDLYGDWKSAQGPTAPSGVGDWFAYLIKQRVAGWIITILAVSLGAPFWFDTLNKFMNIRNAGAQPSTLADRLALQKSS